MTREEHAIKLLSDLKIPEECEIHEAVELAIAALKFVKEAKAMINRLMADNVWLLEELYSREAGK